MTPTPELRPVPGMSDAPTLTASGGQIRIAAPGEPDRAIPAGVVASIARYSTTMEIRRRYSVRRVTRVGWRLLDATGNGVAWLVNSDRPAYAEDAVRRFADAAGLQVIDSGALSRDDLLGNSGDRVGPGTSAAGSLVAPPFQWAMALVILGGVGLFAAPFVRDGLSNTWRVVGVLTVFVGIFVAAFIAPQLGVVQFVWREQRYRRRNSAHLLRPQSRAPGVCVTLSDGRVRVYDIARSWDGPTEITTLVPYDVTGSGRRDEVGLIVRWARGGYVDIPDAFDDAEVRSFAAAHGIQVGQAHVGQMPKEPSVAERARIGYVKWARSLAWIAPLLWLVAIGGSVVAVLGLTNVMALPTGLCVGLLGFALWVAGGYLVAKYRFTDSLVHPERL